MIISNLFHKCELFLLTFNLFPSIPPTTDKHKLRNQLISTRLLISLLTISLSTLLLYNSLINITQIIQVEKPSFQNYSALYQKHSQTLTCDCTEISINYKIFIDIQYSLHQVCQSDFVTQKWINYLANAPGNGDTFYDAFRVRSSYAFQALNTFCVLVNETVSTQLIQFYSNQYISASLIPSVVLESQTETFISQFLLSTTAEFLASLAMIRNITQSNALVSGQFTNYRLYVNTNNLVFSKPIFYDDCVCSSSATCTEQYTILKYPEFKQTFLVPGFYLGCYTVEALLDSTLECFFDQTCVDEIKLNLDPSTSMNVSALNISLSKRFFEDSTIGDLLNHLMVEEWNSPTTYQNYYNECKPSRCVYTKIAKNSALYIVTTVIGLLGGLITVLNVVVPIFVNFISKYICKVATVENEPTERKPKLVPPTTDEQKLRNERVSTRLLILLLIISLFTLLLYTASINITQTVLVEQPSLQKYSELYHIHGQTLSCNCTEISINYKKFIDIQYSLHQVCQSDFITQKWINYLAISFGGVLKEHMNFRMVGAFIFQGLSTLCSLVNETISNRLTQFYSNQYISAFVIPKDIFESQTTTFIDQFKLSTVHDFLLSLTMMRNTTQSNALVSSLFTNFKLAYNYYRGPASSSPRKYGDCTCALSPRCVVTATISDPYDGTSPFSIPGLYVGCYTIEALLQSNLQCFYNITCINKLKSYFTESTPMNVTALNVSLSNRFSKDSTIENILKKLMVEKWNSSNTYGKYYNECQPSKCSYTKTTKNSAIYIVNTLFGLIGGLITALKMFVPKFVSFVDFCIRKWRSRRIQVISSSTD
ncbi:unnamed protein product [Adineta ricciae]|uniref:Uncharacterized protein n=1 Tax=Adineta ricciae TaxID=249248 RepID=A0A815TRT9_ADIRI|nr:unnamed protein product [Adineta ricciae]